MGLHRPLEGGDIKITGWQRDTAMQDGDIRDGVDCGPRLIAVKTEGAPSKGDGGPAYALNLAAPTEVTPCRQAVCPPPWLPPGSINQDAYGRRPVLLFKIDHRGVGHMLFTFPIAEVCPPNSHTASVSDPPHSATRSHGD